MGYKRQEWKELKGRRRWRLGTDVDPSICLVRTITPLYWGWQSPNATEIEHGPTHSSLDCPLAPEQMVLTCLAAGQWSASERQKKTELGKPNLLHPSQRQARIFQRLRSEPGVSISIPGSQAEGLKTKAASMALGVCVCHEGCLAQVGSPWGMDFRGGKMGLGEAKPPP